MIAFFRNVLATLIGLFIFTFCIILVVLGIIGGIALSKEDAPIVNENSVLQFRLEGLVVENTVDDPLEDVFSDQPKKIGLQQILRALKEAQKDDKIAGIFLESKYLQLGMASLVEIRDALLDFKESGKFVYAYGDYVSELDYFLLSTADSIFLNPVGQLEFNGFAANVTYYKGLLDKLDVEPLIFRVGSFKSYVEPYMRKNMSEENRLQYKSILSSIYENYIQDIAQSRQEQVEKLKKISKEMLVRNAEDAQDFNLIDVVGYKQDVDKMIKEKLKIKPKGSIDFITLKDYIKVTEENKENHKDKIAVIVANGTIMPSGKDEDNTVGGEEFATYIKKARENKKVKAIVLRINSPGGSLLGSELIWKEVHKTKGVKPIIASMGNVAASGGYYIATATDTIVAQPTTITGSIGIFFILFNVNNFLENKIGISHDGVGTGDYSDFISITRPMKDYEKNYLQKTVEDGYDTFIDKVAKGRKMNASDVKKIAEGRVWTGEQAKENGLVDILGTYEEAIKLAAKMSNIDKYSLKVYPRPKPILEKILDDLAVQIKTRMGTSEWIVYQKQLQELKNLEGIQARMPMNFEIE